MGPGVLVGPRPVPDLPISEAGPALVLLVATHSPLVKEAHYMRHTARYSCSAPEFKKCNEARSPVGMSSYLSLSYLEDKWW